MTVVIKRISDVGWNRSDPPYMRDEDRRGLRVGASCFEALIIRKGIKPSHNRTGRLDEDRTEYVDYFIQDELGHRAYKCRGHPSVIKRQREIASEIDGKVLDALMEWCQETSHGAYIPTSDAKWVVDRTNEILLLFECEKAQQHYREWLSCVVVAIEKRIKPDALLNWLGEELPSYIRSQGGCVSTDSIARHMIDRELEAQGYKPSLAHDIEIYLRTVGRDIYRFGEDGWGLA